MWKELFYLSKADRRALAFLLSVLFVFIVLRISLPEHETVPVEEVLTSADTVAAKTQDTAVATVRRPEPVRKSGKVRYDKTEMRESGPKQYEESRDMVRATFPKQEKYPYGTVIDLNAADTLELKKIPGIGRYYAKRIFEYGRSLGGYVTTAQLQEIDGLPDSVRNWFMVADTFQVRMIMVNDATLSELRAHPYIDFYKARAIVEYRRRNGRIKDPAQLSLFEEFSGQDMERLSPYLCFD